MTEEEWVACFEPLELLESVREAAPFEQLWRYVVLSLRGIGADQPAESLERLVTEGVNEHNLAVQRAPFWVQSQRTSGGGYSQGRKPVRIPAATQRARAVLAAFQIDAKTSAAAVTRETQHLLQREQCDWLKCLFPNPFRPVTFAPEWRTDTAIALARTMYEAREFGAMPILADALQDAGCDNDDILNHCRAPGAHVRGCWVCDLVLGNS
jgi:hypothetical protein